MWVRKPSGSKTGGCGWPKVHKLDRDIEIWGYFCFVANRQLASAERRGTSIEALAHVKFSVTNAPFLDFCCTTTLMT